MGGSGVERGPPSREATESSRREGSVKVAVNEGVDITMKGLHQSRVRYQKVTAAPTTTPARSQRVSVNTDNKKVKTFIVD